MSDDLTPRDVIARALDQQQVDDEGNADYWVVPDAVLAALNAAGWRISLKPCNAEWVGWPTYCAQPRGHEGPHHASVDTVEWEVFPDVE